MDGGAARSSRVTSSSFEFSTVYFFFVASARNVGCLRRKNSRARARLIKMNYGVKEFVDLYVCMRVCKKAG